MRAEVVKLDLKKLINLPTGFNNLEAKVDDLDVDKLKPFPGDLKKSSDEVSKEVVKTRNSTN